jgi:hypothetical protein
MPCRAWGSHKQLWDRQRQVAEVRCPISYALSPATLETVSNAWSMAWKAFTELAEGVVVVIDRARPGWRLSPGWRLFFLERSFLGKLFRAAADRRRGPPGSLKNRKARTSPHRPKVYTKGSAVRIRAIAGLVIGTAWRLVLVASPGPLFPRRVGAFTLRARDELRRQHRAAGNERSWKIDRGGRAGRCQYSRPPSLAQ